uniref:Uncharacterized protein n=1 Tax=Arundo donax TaxID=35708 RepID=A0A0A9EXZ4_ARUDO
MTMRRRQWWSVTEHAGSLVAPGTALPPRARSLQYTTNYTEITTERK